MAKAFTLQTVARLREERRDAARARLADALRAADVLEQRRADLAERFEQLLQQRRSASETSDTAWLLNAGRYELVLRADEKTLAENRKTIEQEIERRRVALAEADRDVRALELLKQRHEQRQRAEARRVEGRRLDEFVMTRRALQTQPTDPVI